MNFCIVEEDPEYHKLILGNLISIDFIYKNYNILIACSDKTKEYILNFPFKFNGNIEWYILQELDDNNIRYAKNILLSLREALNVFTEVIYIHCRIDIINKFIIRDEIKEQGIGFVSRTVEYIKEKISQKYITDILFINNKKYIDDIDNYFDNNIEEWNQYTCEKYDFDQLRDINIRFVKLFNNIGLTLKELHNLKYFLPHEMLVSTEDFFAYDNMLQLKNINKNFQINSNFIKEKSEERKERKESEESEERKESEESEESEERKESEESEEKLVNICALNIRRDVIDNNIIALNKELYNRMAQLNILYMLLINLKYSKNKIEFVIPKREGIGIWNRTNDSPGLYELIDMITKDNEYFGKVEIYVDYFSFNNFILIDKPSYYWLNNSIRKYNGIFLCNYDNTIDAELKNINKPKFFGFYYSDYPNLLEETRQKPITKKRYCIEVFKNKIVEYELSNRKVSLLQKNIITINNPQEKLNIISESTLCFFNEFDVNLLANCLGLDCIPVFKKNLYNINEIYDLKSNINYIIEPQKWGDIININEIVAINRKYFESNILHTNIINNFFNKFYNYCKSISIID